MGEVIRPCLAKKVRVTVVQFGFKMAESELDAHGSTWNHEIFLVILPSVCIYVQYILYIRNPIPGNVLLYLYVESRCSTRATYGGAL